MLSYGQALWSLGPSVCPRSSRAFGARFDCPGFNGRVHLHFDALQDLSAQFAFSPRLSSMRVPAFNYIVFCNGPHAHETLVRVCTGLTHSREFETNVREEVVHHIRMLWYILGGEERWDNVHRSYKQSPGKPGNGSFERGRSL